MAVPICRSGTRAPRHALRPAVLRPVVITIVLTAVFASCLFTSGCSSMEQTVNVYTERASIIIDDLNKQLAELKEYWTLPLKDQGGLKNTQKKYGKAVSEIQKLIDHVDAPLACRELEKQLSIINEKAKSIDRMTTQFSDYMSDMSGVAVEIEDLVAELGVFQKKKDLQTGARQMHEKANTIFSEVKSKVPPPLFRGIQAEFVDFMGGFTEKFYKAAERTKDWKDEEPVEYADEEGSDEENAGEDAKPKDNYRNSALKPILEDVPDDWDAFNIELNEWMAAARDAGGLNAGYAEIEQVIVQAVAEIAKLEKKYSL